MQSIHQLSGRRSCCCCSRGGSVGNLIPAAPRRPPSALTTGLQSQQCSATHPPAQQGCAPLLDAVVARGDRLQEIPLHVPGHKRGRVLDAGMQQLLMAGSMATAQNSQSSPGNALRYDLTELAGLDYLSSPSTVIKAAQDLAAAAFQAQHTWFLINGCSAGIHAAVMATVKPGQALLLSRNCHLSAFSACVLSDAVPVWLQPEQDAMHGIAHCVTPQQLQAGFQEAQQRGLKVGAVLVVSPTYYGAVARIPELVTICRQHGAPLLVDEAHGGHLSPLAQTLEAAAQGQGATSAAAGPQQGVQQGLAAGAHSSQQWRCIPVSALEAGADLVMHSTHKVLTAMTQAAMLHLNKGSDVQPSRISNAVRVLQTSSPSYLLLSSLDAARRHAFASNAWLVPLAAADAARAQLEALPGLCLLQDGSCGAQQSVAGFDPLRAVLNVQGLGLTGYDAAAWLEEQHGIVPELATNKLVVLVFGPGSTAADADALVKACQLLCDANTSQAVPQPPVTATQAPAAHSSAAADHTQKRQGATCEEGVTPPAPAGAVLTPRQAFYADTEAVCLAAAAGRVSAELLCPYPPGVPVVFPGEVFTPASIQVLHDTLASGGVITGAHDSSLATVLVVAEVV